MSNLLVSYIVPILCAYIVSIIIKTIAYTYEYKRFTLIQSLKNGGLSSGHTVFVSSLTTAVWWDQGLSALFIVALCFSIVVAHDSCFLRNQVGKQGKLLEELTGTKFSKAGHSVIEVFIGIIVGVGISSLCIWWFV
ncbi:MAG: divergent PAP2 family protein [Candidatus Woesearchaeota archaeon]